MREECAKLGLEFVDATAPDPLGMQEFQGPVYPRGHVQRMVNKYESKDTAFFSTNCAMQVPLISAVVDTGAIYPQPCCPSPYHGFPSALGIEIPEDNTGRHRLCGCEITRIMAEKGMTGRTSTWPVPVSMMFIEGSSEYAIDWIKGEFQEKVNIPKLKEKFKEYSGVDSELATEKAESEYDNYYCILMDFLDF